MLTIGLFLLLGLFISLQAVFSSLTVLAAAVGMVLCVVAAVRPLWIISLLAVYLPFEPFILKFVSDEVYGYARFFSEGMIYVLCGVVCVQLMAGKIKRKPTVLDWPFLLFVGTLVCSAVINLVPPTIAILGIRQIIRFILVFFVIVHLSPSASYIKQLTIALLSVAIFQSGLGLLQSVIGAPLDAFLLPSETRAVGDITISGVSQFWDPGSRVFATLGRYDRLGSFLYVFLLLAVGFLYEMKPTIQRRSLYLVLGLGLPALLLTFSRASWFAFVLGFIYIGWVLRRDRRVLIGIGAFAIIMTGYLGLSGLNVRLLTETSGQTLAERFYETFSYARWRGEYYGLGRTFWFIETATHVVPAAPILGFGPGQYGGGATAALRNTRVYDELGLPFGVYGEEGTIDISWFSLWGEAGTLGLAFFLWMFVALFRLALRTYRKSEQAFSRALASSFGALLIAVSFGAFLSTLLEIRTLAFYLWLYAGFLFVLSKKPKADHAV